VVEVFRAETRRIWGRETGGPLAGYLSADGAVVVTHAGGPGPRAVHGYATVKIDGGHATAFCDRIFRDSGGRFDYVGDWHRHLAWSLKPSPPDEEAMREVAASGSCSLEAPVSIIYRRIPERFCAYVLGKSGRLLPTPVSVISAIPE
jgi:integrative and conjugative element protein (TIGR02256 family)